VPVTTSLLSEEGKAAFVEAHVAEYKRLREIHGGPKQKLISLAQARENRPKLAWRSEDVPTPEFLGIRALDDFPLATLREFIDWTPFFSHLGAQGRLPAHLGARKIRRAGAADLQRGQRLARPDYRAEADSRARRVRLSFRPTPSATTSSCSPTLSRSKSLARLCFLRQRSTKTKPSRTASAFGLHRSAGQRPCRSHRRASP